MISICLWCYCFFYLHYFISTQNQCYVLHPKLCFPYCAHFFHFKEKDKDRNVSNVKENVDKYVFEPEVMGKNPRKVNLCCWEMWYCTLWCVLISYRRDVLQTLTHILTQHPPAHLGNHYSKIVFQICHIDSKGPLGLAIWTNLPHIVAHSLHGAAKTQPVMLQCLPRLSETAHRGVKSEL